MRYNVYHYGEHTVTRQKTDNANHPELPAAERFLNRQATFGRIQLACGWLPASIRQLSHLTWVAAQ